jgi:hypothetical protein
VVSANGIDWTELDRTPWPSRHATSVFVYEDALWIAAGFLKNDVWRLDSSAIYTPVASGHSKP